MYIDIVHCKHCRSKMRDVLMRCLGAERGVGLGGPLQQNVKISYALLFTYLLRLLPLSRGIKNGTRSLYST
jgi:hypothetical protein